MNQLHGMQELVIPSLVGALAVLIALLSLWRNDARLMTLLSPRMHRLGHFSCYVLLAFLCAIALASVWPSALPRALGGFVIATGFGAVMEYLQRFRPGRSPSVSDALVNAAGSALGALLALGWL